MAVLSEEQAAAIPATTRVLELGCGQIKRVPHSITVDINPASIADVIHDLNKLPYPFEDNEFDFVVAEHVIEHLGSVIGIMEELHRITKPGGIIYVEVPHFSSANFFTDPTHTHSFTTRSFDYFVPGLWLASYRYSPVQFKKRYVRIEFDEPNRLRRLMQRWASKNYQDYEHYEQKYAFMFPAGHINFELEVIK